MPSIPMIFGNSRPGSILNLPVKPKQYRLENNRLPPQPPWLLGRKLASQNDVHLAVYLELPQTLILGQQHGNLQLLIRLQTGDLQKFSPHRTDQVTLESSRLTAHVPTAKTNLKRTRSASIQIHLAKYPNGAGPDWRPSQKQERQLFRPISTFPLRGHQSQRAS